MKNINNKSKPQKNIKNTQDTKNSKPSKIFGVLASLNFFKNFKKIKAVSFLNLASISQNTGARDSRPPSKAWAAAALIFSVFAIASLLTGLTGSVGMVFEDVFLTLLGGASFIPLIFMAYFSYMRLANRPAPLIKRHVWGVVCLTLSFSIFLGMLEKVTNSLPALLSAGLMGESLTGFFISAFGPLGLTIVGIALTFFTMAAFLGGTPFDFFERGSAHLAWKRLKKDDKASKKPIKRNKHDYSEDKSGENITEYDEEYKPNEIENEAEDEIQGNTEDEEDYDEPYLPFPPPTYLLGSGDTSSDMSAEEEAHISSLGNKIIDVLSGFGISASIAEIISGPSLIQFSLRIAAGTKVAKIASLSNDLALALAVQSLRVQTPLPGKPYVGIEIPNPNRRPVYLRAMLENKAFTEGEAYLPLPLGIASDGECVVVGLEDLPHLLVAGTTGSGKSVFINSCIVGLCSALTPQELQLILIDPKRVELSIYEKLPHAMTSPITSSEDALKALSFAVDEMTRRYDYFAKNKNRNITSYNNSVDEEDILPHIVIVIDELSDLMMSSPKEVEDSICRLAQMSRATGIHLIIATQRPSVNVITGLIKANIPARAAFCLPSQIDSRTILDTAGAERLLGKGDMLFLSSQWPRPVRLQAPWIAEEDLFNWLDYMSDTFYKSKKTDILNISQEEGGKR